MTTEPQGENRIVLVTGPSGAGRSTALSALEDIGFETIDNLPLSLLEPMLSARRARPMALGIDVRNRDFSTDSVLRAIDALADDLNAEVETLFLDADRQVLIRRYSETRRRHPLAPAEAPDIGVGRELDLLGPIRQRADVLIDTSNTTPHDLRAEIERVFTTGETQRLAISVESFSYKRGLPTGADLVFDVRFLRNPHWDQDLRAYDGRDAKVVAYISQDARFDPFWTKLRDLLDLLLPAYGEEGKTHLSVAFGCTGGQHRSVAFAEKLAEGLAGDGWQVSTRHRELERRAGASPESQGGQQS